MVELADTSDLKSEVYGRTGSSPVGGTIDRVVSAIRSVGRQTREDRAERANPLRLRVLIRSFRSQKPFTYGPGAQLG